MKIAKKLLVGAAASILLLTGCSAADDGGDSTNGSDETQHLKVAVYGSGEESVIDIAEEQGWFEEAGISVEKVIIGAPPAVVASAQSGEVDIALVPSVLAARVIVEGVPLTIVGSVDGYPAEDKETYDANILFASPASNITSIDELEGATIAVSARGSLFEVVITNSLLENGVDPESINWVAMDFASSLPALEEGTIDAAPMISPMTADAMNRGMVPLGYPTSDFLGKVPVDYWVSSPQVIEERGDAIRAFRDATYRAAEWANENPDAVKELAIEIGGVDVAPEDVNAIYFPAEVDQAALEAMVSRMVEMGFLEENDATFTVLD